MTRVNIPSNVNGEAPHTYLGAKCSGYNGLTNTSYNSQTVNGDILKSALENDIIINQGKYGAFIINESPSFFIDFHVETSFTLWAIGSFYSDSGGYNGKGIKIYEVNNGVQGRLVATLPSTQTNGKWYEVFSATKGTYRILGTGSYVGFDEFYFESKEPPRSLIHHNGEYKKYIIENGVFSWRSTSVLPTSTQFKEDGMDSLSPLLDRRIETLEPLPMTDKSEILGVGEVGKVFSTTIDLKKYIDLRSIEIEVK